MNTNPKDTAFPLCVHLSDEEWRAEYGLSKREYFAAIALQGLFASGALTPELAAAKAVKTADALIAALNGELRGDRLKQAGEPPA